jgi:plastocyanin
MAFQPAELTVHIGETVEWENQDLVSHTTTSNTGVWDSGPLAPDEKFTFVFNALGDFPYHCSFHPEMTGVLRHSDPRHAHSMLQSGWCKSK